MNQKSNMRTSDAIRRDTVWTILLNGLPALVVVPLALWIVASPERRASVDWVYWYVLAVALVHTMEEYLWPGGFVQWFNVVAFGSADANTPLSARRALITDGVAALSIVPVMLLLARSYPVPVLVFASLLLINGFFHICETLKNGVYSPGVVTSVVLYLPVLTWVFYFYLNNSVVSPAEAAFSIGVGMALTALFFYLVRRWQRMDGDQTRAAAMQAPT